MKQRILHAPVNVGGQAAKLARAERLLGREACSLSFKGSRFGLPETDLCLHLEKRSKSVRPFFQLASFLRTLARFDVFVFHYGETFLPFRLDLPLLRLMGKRVFFFFHGSDLRKWEKASLAKRGEGVFVSTPDLKLDFLPEAVWIPQPIFLDDLPPPARKGGGRPRVLHAPTRRDLKGTGAVLAAVKKLEGEGLAFEFRLLEGLAHRDLLAEVARSDIVIDNIRLGAYGNLSVEGMALGKAVLCDIRGDVRGFLPGCPVVPADAVSLAPALRELIEWVEKREELGRRGREYVRAVHEARTVAERLLSAIGA